ncbi:hypothetical protein ALQ05_200132 [Pseudomonas amygdali pv. mori]|uniref:Uncharacterized protein n=1 Tax=Pseudomonas amygdali pv. mori TaxID=34065 RepID=A0A3M4LCB6_PSEA0|nr:hypothetical protein ALQ05_200132 [Pseudomonas amygdali pv. mori]RMU01712.1 hypothetical protein ALP35_00379 [Pseudomonas savastanoi pv. glycinea]RMU24233.1 hypothetical protein ALP34_01782 [Pseudomonas savastanoi pv. glycinea]
MEGSMHNRLRAALVLRSTFFIYPAFSEGNLVISQRAG